MNGLRVTALVVLAFSLALLVSPAVASAPVLSPAAAPADAPSITAMGFGVAQSSASDPFAVGQTLFIGVHSNADAAGVQKAADELMARLDRIKTALIEAGVPADGVRTTGFNVNPNFGPMKPGMSPAEGGQAAPIASLSLSASLSADVPSIRLLLAAMNAATSHGATTINANAGKGGSPYGAVRPSAADLAKATEAAVANARATAEALAAASGKRLGGIRSVTSQVPTMGCCPPNSGWSVQVTVTFDIAQ